MPGLEMEEEHRKVVEKICSGIVLPLYEGQCIIIIACYVMKASMPC